MRIYNYLVEKMDTQIYDEIIGFINNSPLNTENLNIFGSMIEKINFRELDDELRSDLSIQVMKRIKKVYENCYKSNLSSTTLLKLFRLAPNKELKESIMKYGELYRVMYIPIYTLMYLSGLPLETLDPEIIEKDGYENEIRLKFKDMWEVIASEMYKQNEKHIENLKRSIGYSGYLVSNIDSVYQENIYDFYPFDLVSYIVSDGRISTITRREFDFVIKEKRDPWTNKSIPKNILASIKAKKTIAKLFHLPDCATIKELIDKILFPKTDIHDILTKRTSGIIQKNRRYSIPNYYSTSDEEDSLRTSHRHPPTRSPVDHSANIYHTSDETDYTSSDEYECDIHEMHVIPTETNHQVNINSLTEFLNIPEEELKAGYGRFMEQLQNASEQERNEFAQIAMLGINNISNEWSTLPDELKEKFVKVFTQTVNNPK